MDLEGSQESTKNQGSFSGEMKNGPGLFRPLFWGTSLALVLLDLGSKAWAFSFLSQSSDLRFPPSHEVFPGFFYLAKVENKGTVWGLFQNGTLPLTFVRILMVSALLFFAYRIRSGGIKLLALGMILGGALGNLYDNLFWQGGVFQGEGAVRDFLDFYIPIPFRDAPYHWPTFNVADASILVGAFLLFIALHREERHKSKPVEIRTEAEK
jgi:signal peptidase II